ncbi:MAG: hypothetical protein LW854_05500, partial [Rubrivivax sp.]|nr:hypothetical protein [Rubrivivax sp.]
MPRRLKTGRRTIPSHARTESPQGLVHRGRRAAILALGAGGSSLALATVQLTANPSATAAPGAASAVVQTDQARAELVAQAPGGVAPGQPIWLGLKIEHAPHWHTYWRNPGDSGLPTTLQFELPAGFSVGE